MKYNPELDIKKLSEIKKYKNNPEHRKRYKRWKKERVRRGFSGCDMWNLDKFLIHIIADTLDHFASHHHGTPYGWDKDDYTNYITSIAADLRKANEHTILGKDNYDAETANNLLRSAFMRLSNIFWSLWN